MILGPTDKQGNFWAKFKALLSHAWNGIFNLDFWFSKKGRNYTTGPWYYKKSAPVDSRAWG